MGEQGYGEKKEGSGGGVRRTGVRRKKNDGLGEERTEEGKGVRGRDKRGLSRERETGRGGGG